MLYVKLVTKEKEKDIYKLAKVREKKISDLRKLGVQKVKIIYKVLISEG